MASNENIRVDDFKGRFRDIERRLRALERMPATFDLPFVMNPFQNYDSTGRAIPITVTGEWVVAFYSSFPVAWFPGIAAELHVLTPAATTAEVRLTNFVVGGSSSNAVLVPASTDLFHEAKWLHSQPLGTGPFIPTVECRRTSGTGVVQCFAPITPMLMTQQTINLLGGYTTTA